jgi:hypothetical protein
MQIPFECFCNVDYVAARDSVVMWRGIRGPGRGRGQGSNRLGKVNTTLGPSLTENPGYTRQNIDRRVKYFSFIPTSTMNI